MKVKNIEGKVVIQHAICKCGGEFISDPSDIFLSTFPPKYPHKCDKCGRIESFTVVYPCTTIKEHTKFKLLKILFGGR